MKRNDLVSSVVEGGIESAQNFLSKLITPTFEETGLLIKDQVTRWRFYNQVKMINKAKAYCEKNHINPKAISLKLLVPLLDYSGIEEDDVMQNGWAILLSNMVDSDQNIENHVFPYILSQLSTSEFKALEQIYEAKQKRLQHLQTELNEFRKERPQKELEIKQRIEVIGKELEKQRDNSSFDKFTDLYREKGTLERQLNSNTYKEVYILDSMKLPESLPSLTLKDFEVSNLIRLGLLKEEKEFYAPSQKLEIPNDDRHSEYNYVNLKIDVDSVVEINLTELGELFISACKEKQEKSPTD
jgi:hypothetical protein